MKIRPLFEKYQKYLLAFANTKVGRQYLSLDKWAKVKNNHRIIKVTPDGIHFFTGEFNKKGLPICQAVFFSRSPYLKKFRLALEGLDIASDVIGKIHNPEFVIPHFGGLVTPRVWLPLVMRDEVPFYPDANPESTSVDGSLASSADATWANVRDAVNAETAFPSSTTEYNIWAQLDTGSNYSIRRGIFLYDISSLSGKRVVSANTQLYTYNLQDDDNDGDDFVRIVSSAPATNTNIVAGDFDSFGTTAYAGDIDIGNLSANAYNTWTMNSTGRAFLQSAINGDGIVKLGTREGHDALDHPIVGESLNRMKTYFADNGSNKPKLVVTYTLPAAGGSILWFGLKSLGA